MRRTIIILMVGTLMCLAGFGQEFKTGVSSGGFWALKEGFGAGYGEWSFPLRNESDGFLLRDCIDIGGFGGTTNENKEFGGCILSNKFIIGSALKVETFIVRSYGFASLGFGLFNAESHKLFSTPFLLSSIIGGGFEFQYSRSNSFVIEFGGDMDFIIGNERNAFTRFNNQGPILMLGFRSYR